MNFLIAPEERDLVKKILSSNKVYLALGEFPIAFIDSIFILTRFVDDKLMRSTLYVNLPLSATRTAYIMFKYGEVIDGSILTQDIKVKYSISTTELLEGYKRSNEIIQLCISELGNTS